MAKNDLKGIDVAWKDKTVCWKNIKENDAIKRKEVENLFKDMSKKKEVVERTESVAIDINKEKKFFDESKQQNMFIVISRMPKAEILVNSINQLNRTQVSLDNLKSLLRNWPVDDIDLLIAEDKECPNAKWGIVEQYFLTLSKKKLFNVRIKIWLFYIEFH